MMYLAEVVGSLDGGRRGAFGHVTAAARWRHLGRTVSGSVAPPSSWPGWPRRAGRCARRWAAAETRAPRPERHGASRLPTARWDQGSARSPGWLTGRGIRTPPKRSVVCRRRADPADQIARTKRVIVRREGLTKRSTSVAPTERATRSDAVFSASMRMWAADALV